MKKKILVCLFLVLCAGFLNNFASAAHQVRFRWPCGFRARVVARFDPPAKKWLAGHRGVDLACGSTIVAPADGTVYFSGKVAGKPVISIAHGPHLRTTYEPVVSTLRKGQRVKAGEVIGSLNAGHHGALHWGALVGKDVYVNPLQFLAGPIRLKPL
ncbi:MAG: M23 family metallopeptidase [Winkia neuii]|uniref:M23 family peptidase n=1 Tax=Winkia neuii TaxID=33007 RepID=A0A2I1IPA6_9ACTO|nr:M23 family metallopeptidase [Winkia neuii]OFJ71435.1 hypothetical protein HMPREF2851_07845 [Actinomyces sp. HMSC064C12]OFK01409.1 hypothetical protein HMPREF2835_09245 [Actinomyces sp. HMSC072A03]OFT55483.1 hypothetical protein HMPREF3152_05270 [Actinomyces sp. HMSC06A08]KWZ72908.1 peptidase, M23 family [Winkia neuii]MDK8100166.1 M23 family metallopeptidase [Winkia neuii]